MREEQEDSTILLTSQPEGAYFLVLADGAGGHGGGRNASQAVVRLAAEMWDQVFECRWQDELDFLQDFAHEAHQRVRVAAAEIGRDARTTLIAVVVVGNRAAWIQSGDSRLYHFREGQQIFRTLDHSLAEAMRRRAQLDDPFAKQAVKAKNILLQALGGSDYKQPSMGRLQMEPEDVLLLCSDGFWGALEDEELGAWIRHTDGVQLGVREALLEAVERGAERADNASVVVLAPVQTRSSKEFSRESLGTTVQDAEFQLAPEPAMAC